jgi:protein-S-isoprenylcysteine O-methyltransferase Ste14
MASQEKTGNKIGRTFAILGTAAFLILAPGTVAGLIPWWISRWRLRQPLLGFTPFRVIGVLLEGIGTPAPALPARHLVVKGSYRFVRNPMYVAVTALILGQALFLGDVHLLEYAIIPWLAAHLFVLFYEEPTLRRSFGTEYENYRAYVPRWIPRLTPWHRATNK